MRLRVFEENTTENTPITALSVFGKLFKEDIMTLEVQNLLVNSSMRLNISPSFQAIFLIPAGSNFELARKYKASDNGFSTPMLSARVSIATSTRILQSMTSETEIYKNLHQKYYSKDDGHKKFKTFL